MAERLPSLRPDQLIAKLQRAGFYVAREGARHTVLYDRKQPEVAISVPRHSKEMKRGLLAGLIKDAGLTQEDFLKL